MVSACSIFVPLLADLEQAVAYAEAYRPDQVVPNDPDDANDEGTVWALEFPALFCPSDRSTPPNAEEVGRTNYVVSFGDWLESHHAPNPSGIDIHLSRFINPRGFASVLQINPQTPSLAQGIFRDAPLSTLH